MWKNLQQFVEVKIVLLSAVLNEQGHSRRRMNRDGAHEARPLHGMVPLLFPRDGGEKIQNSENEHYGAKTRLCG